MRRSSAVKLTLLPLLASSALAYADITDDPPPMQPTTATPAPEPSPPAGYVLPPGMTPTIYELDCEHDPNWEWREDCQDGSYYDDDGVVVRGGFGGYFWSGGG